jgi:hypothetical protein
MLICPHWSIIFSIDCTAWSLPSERAEKCLETSLFFLDRLSVFLAPSVPTLLKKGGVGVSSPCGHHPPFTDHLNLVASYLQDIDERSQMRSGFVQERLCQCSRLRAIFHV